MFTLAFRIQLDGYQPGMNTTVVKQCGLSNQKMFNMDSEEQIVENYLGVTYIDKEKLDLLFVSLIIRVESINHTYGTLKSFIETYCSFGITNGKLLILHEMNDPADWLIRFSKKTLIPLGFREKTDYLFADERLVLDNDQEIDSLLNQQHPLCKEVLWLNSVITKKGNYIWYRNDLTKVEQ